jgi:hypothetical protein
MDGYGWVDGRNGLDWTGLDWAMGSWNGMGWAGGVLHLRFAFFPDSFSIVFFETNALFGSA